MRKRIVIGAVLAISLVQIPAAHADANLVPNPGVETLDAGGFAQCWQQAGWGDNDYTATVDGRPHSGAHALAVSVTRIASGDRKALIKQDTTCAPTVTIGHQYDLSLWYTTSTANSVVTVFRHDTKTGWQYWTDLATLPVTSEYRQAKVRTPQIPAGTDQISWGATIFGVGTLTTDDYSMADATPPPPPVDPCTANDCVHGRWDVLSYQAPVRGIHSVLLNTGKVLLIAGSGNDPEAFKAGSFTSTVYDPVAGTFTPVPTPEDLFCAGHVQLPDGRVLVVGGNKSYAAPDGSHGYEGLKSSYVFDPATNSYQKLNDLNGGHWYPSATELGNGDVLSLGGLDEKSSGSVTTEYFSNAQQRWLGMNETKQTWHFWGLYPSMILMADGRLFYTGSHVFGNGLPGSGASTYNYASQTITDVPGLQDKDNRDQSMSVLLPPAQDQRVLTVGGGNIVSNVDANRLTDLVDLSKPDPAYMPGPMLPADHAGHGKMYVSAVLLPNGKVFETGGGLHNRADPVFEASMFDPATNTFAAGMATDPVPRTYHSSAFLLPDGRVMAIGNNPGDGSFDQRISIYSPSYLFSGTRPRITSVAGQEWSYGSTQQVTVEGSVTRAALIRPAAVTHSSDPNQRYVDLPMTVDGGRIGLNLTANPNLAPPGWYMLFVSDANGVPSVAQWVHVGGPAPVRAAAPVPEQHHHEAPPVAVTEGSDGCDHAYGTSNQCVPWNLDDKQPCTWLRAHGFGELAVHGRDRHHLDTNSDGIACGPGDGL